MDRVRGYLLFPKPECIVWDGAINKTGYAVIRWNRHPMLASRVIWAMMRGPIPDGMHILHHCDNPPCINPRHLFMGTHADNMRDMIAKGRKHTKITSQEAAIIRESDKSNQALAAQYGLKERQIRNIKSGASWPLPPKEG